MIKKKILLLTLLIIGLLAISTVNASEITNETDSSIVDENNGLLVSNSEDNVLRANDNLVTDDVDGDKLTYSQEQIDAYSYSFTKLSQDISSTKSGKTYELTNDFVYTSSLDSKYKNGIDVSKSITIDGNGYTIDGSHSSSIFNIKADNVVLKNIKIINGTYTSINGHTILWSGSNGICQNVSFINNDGGTVFWNGKYGTISDCDFINNTNARSGGGAIYLSNTNINIYNCLFVNNSATDDNYGSGGAIYTAYWSGNINNCVFTNNFASNKGGAIYLGSSNANITQCNFTKNTAGTKKLGGAIYVAGEYNTICDCIFVENKGTIALLNEKIKNNISNNHIIGDESQDSGKETFYPLVEYLNYTEYSAGYFNHQLLVNISYNETSSNFTSFSFIQDKKNYTIGVKILEDFRGYVVLKKYMEVPNSKVAGGVITISEEKTRSYFRHVGDEYKINADKLEPATYSLSIYKFDGNNWFCISSVYFDVSPNINIDVSEIAKFYGATDKFTATIVNDAGVPISGAPVSITINGVEYKRVTDSQGVASLALGLSSGSYKILTNCGLVNKTSSVKIYNTINANDVTKIFKNGTQYYARFINTLGFPLENMDVTFNINGVMYTRKTDSMGIARMNINLAPGKYILTAINPINNEQLSSTITVLSNILKNKDLYKYYKNDSQYVVFVRDGDGIQPAVGKTVTFNINGVFYTRATNESGYAKLNINLAPGDYIITADCDGNMISNKIHVKPTVEVDAFWRPWYDHTRGSQFKVKLRDGEGNPFAYQTVTFNINGVFYQRTSDSKGIASLNINLLAGMYVITSNFNGCMISSIIKVRETSGSPVYNSSTSGGSSSNSSASNSSTSGGSASNSSSSNSSTSGGSSSNSSSSGAYNAAYDSININDYENVTILNIGKYDEYVIKNSGNYQFKTMVSQYSNTMVNVILSNKKLGSNGNYGYVHKNYYMSSVYSNMTGTWQWSAWRVSGVYMKDNSGVWHWSLGDTSADVHKYRYSTNDFAITKVAIKIQEGLSGDGYSFLPTCKEIGAPDVDKNGITREYAIAHNMTYNPKTECYF